MPRAVLLAGGWAHPGKDLIAAVRALVAERSFELAVVTEPTHAAEEIAAGCELLVVGCCWFSMHDDRYTTDQRSAHAVAFDGELRHAVAALVANGCPVLALHTAVISFDGDPLWADTLGGTWNWATSWHPEPGPITVRPAPEAPIEFDKFSVIDELYQGLDIHDSATIVAESDNGDPLVWLHEHAGRAAVNLLGHDQRSLTHPAHGNVNARLLDWLLAP